MTKKITSEQCEHIWHKIGRLTVNLMYPPRCPICDEVLRWGERICQKCESKITYIEEPVCKRCGRPVESDTIEFCYDCTKRHHKYHSGKALFLYQGGIRQSLYRFKYANKREYAAFYAGQTAMRYGEWIRRCGVEAIIPVPLHRKRRKKRGYNQAGLYAKELGKCLGIPVEDKLVCRVKATRPQKELGDAERKNNLKNAFKCTQNIVQLRYVLIVDDIYTTGSTMDAVALVLKDAGVKEVFFICISIGRGL